jgi:hypothetical protein
MDHAKLSFFQPSNMRRVDKNECACCGTWTADIAVFQGDVVLASFKSITFIESDGVAFIAGIEEPSGVSERFYVSDPTEQKSLIDYLRNASMEILGAYPAGLFDNLEYYYENLATSMYIHARGISAEAAFGFWDGDTFDRISITPMMGQASLAAILRNE